MMKLRIAGVVNDSVVDGPGIRYTVFTQGCEHGCHGCHNVHTHDIHGGYEIELEELIEQMKKNPLLDGLTISGGEPFLQPLACAELAEQAKKNGLHIMVYSGFTYEQLRKRSDCVRLLKEIDLLVDGPFIQDKKSLSLLFRGSSNQRIIDVQKSLKNDKVILMDL